VASRTWTDADSRGAVISWLRPHRERVRLVKYDSAGLGVFYADPLREAGFRCEGINVASSPLDKERYSNLKSEMYWNLRARFQSGAVSGLDDETLAELAGIQWLVDVRGRTAIESKESVRSTLGHSPDRAEALCMALGTHWEVPHMIIAPSTSWQNMKSLDVYHDRCTELDAQEDGVLGSQNVWLRRSTSRGRWDAF
jgi:hypothetical protein